MITSNGDGNVSKKCLSDGWCCFRRCGSISERGKPGIKPGFGLMNATRMKLQIKQL